MTFDLDPEFIELVRACEYGSIDRAPEGYDIQADHEVNYALFARDGLFQLGRYERRGPLALIAASTDVADLERFLVREIGDSYRIYNRLPAIDLPHAPESVREGYQVVHIGAEVFSLRRPDGTQLGMQIEDYPPTVPHTCRFSHLADRPLKSLVESYLQPAGTPLFADFDEG